jgi:hypothetical protein
MIANKLVQSKPPVTIDDLERLVNSQLPNLPVVQKKLERARKWAAAYLTETNPANSGRVQV